MIDYTQLSNGAQEIVYNFVLSLDNKRIPSVIFPKSGVK